MLLSISVCSFCAFIFPHHFLSHTESQGWPRWQRAPKHWHYHQQLVTPAALPLTPGAIQCHSNDSMPEQPELLHPHSDCSRYTLRKHLPEQTDSGNYTPITPPRQQHKYNKHVINPANKTIRRVRLLHLPSLTHLPTPLSKSLNHSLCHLENWDVAAASVLPGYQETVYWSLWRKLRYWDAMTCHGLYCARCWLWPGSSKALKHLVIP